MREEIRLGNEALACRDMETAKQHFEQLLTKGGTPLQERIATNRLREIREQQEILDKPPPTKSRTRRKATEHPKRDASPKHTFVRPPDKPLVVIKRHS
jgi:hypothetical protein